MDGLTLECLFSQIRMRIKYIVTYIAVLMLSITCPKVWAQEDDSVILQNIHGYITDAESKEPIEGVTILLESDKSISAFSDSDGYFVLADVPVGRQTIIASFVGYETHTVAEILVTSGKETELNISLKEKLTNLKEVTVTAGKNTKPVNEFATLSARSFSVEDTRRYPASISDPARMAMNFAGVANNGDLENDIVVRGNSPKGILWRLEGIEIPNPNHFSELGTSGGAVSMINANTLGTSDFYTGAFPAEMGNALSGVFDLNMRNGNRDNYEHIFQIGLLGTEIATEGPFRQGGQSSYLIDYRYSTLALIQNKLNLNGLIPDYQDLSFKMNFPIKKAGTISIFGLGGSNRLRTDPAKDSTEWTDANPNLKLSNISKTGITGISYLKFLSQRSYIKAVLSASYTQANKHSDTLNVLDSYNPVNTEYGSFQNSAIRLSVLYNNKLSKRNTFRSGIVLHELGYKLNDRQYDFGTRQWNEILDGNGSTEYYQVYTQLKTRITDKITTTAGIHASYYALNKKYSIEPRASITYGIGNNKLSIATGWHSKPDNISTYLYRDPSLSSTNIYPNMGLDLLRAYHLVAGYETVLPLQIHLKTELYYQYLYNIPVEMDTSSGFSIINAENVYSLIGTKQLISTGTGRNYGIDITVERPFANNYYFLVTGSLYRSTYTNYKGDTYNGHFNRTYQCNVVAGKEFYLDKRKHELLGLNGKVLYSGGQRESPIDAAQSIAAGRTIYTNGLFYTLQDPYYFRIDAGCYLKLNNRKATHILELNLQNATNRRNYSYTYFDTRSNTIKYVRETGLIPAISYRIEFHTTKFAPHIRKRTSK